MRVLLPPSETKVAGGGSSFSPERLSFAAALSEARAKVRAALEELSRDEEAAIRALKLGAKSRAELAHNLVLGSSGALPAIERYTGVLYDALRLSHLQPTARGWIDRNVLIQSALFGLIAADDMIPAYRLSASTRLTSLSHPLKRVWSNAHAKIDWASLGWVLDLRSKDYAALAPLDSGRASTLNVVQRGEDGNVRALNHFNKAAKGELVRSLALNEAAVSSAREFVEWANSIGHETRLSEDEEIVTLVVK